MKAIVFFLVGLGLAGAFFGYLVSGWSAAGSFVLGSGLMLLNLGALVWIVRSMMRKKFIALGLLVIVFKYAIFGALIANFLTLSWAQPLWFLAGIGTLVLASLAGAWHLNDDENQKE